MKITSLGVLHKLLNVKEVMIVLIIMMIILKKNNDEMTMIIKNKMMMINIVNKLLFIKYFKILYEL